jgi:hypothetical protein
VGVHEHHAVIVEQDPAGVERQMQITILCGQARDTDLRRHLSSIPPSCSCGKSDRYKPSVVGCAVKFVISIDPGGSRRAFFFYSSMPFFYQIINFAPIERPLTDLSWICMGFFALAA